MQLNTLILASTVCGVAISCDLLTPFRASLIGKTFREQSSCIRPDPGSRIDISENSFTYKTVSFRNFLCGETYVFNFSSNVPTITFSPGKFDFKSGSNAESEEYCKEHFQKTKKLLRPRGSTKKRFFKTLKVIVKGLDKIKKFQCPTPEDLVVTDEVKMLYPKFGNVEVEGIITYLLGIGYKYKVCVGKGL